MRTRVVVGVVAVLAALAGCTSSPDAVSPSPVSAAYQQWAESVTCPATVAALQASAAAPRAPATPRPGTDRSITPPGPVVAVVRCDETHAIASADDGTATERTAVQRTPLLDAQPVSWFADGDHWPRRAGDPVFAPDAGIVSLHYASGPDVVVARSVTESGATRYDNGVLRCEVVPDDTESVTTCRPRGGGASFVAPVRPVAAGAPPVDCPSTKAVDAAASKPSPAASPRPGAERTPVPPAGLVVAVTCGNSTGSGPWTFWGADALARFAHVPAPTPVTVAHCLSFGPPCTGAVTVAYQGYASGPPVRTVSRSDALSSRSWLRPAAGLDGGITNGVIACRYSMRDVSPSEISGCLPFAQATAGAVPVPSGSAAP